MPWLPDTNVWICLLKNPGGKLEARVRAQPTHDVFLCSVVKAELWHGAKNSGTGNAEWGFRHALRAFCVTPL